MSDATGAFDSAFDRAAFAAHWGLAFTYGLVCIGLGVVLAVWPDETLVVCAVLIAIQLLVSGVLRIVMALGTPGLEGGVRVLAGLLGALALVVGLLFLRDPVQSLLVVTMLLGVWWLVSGVIDVITAIVAPSPGRRTWDLVTGVVSVLAGGFLLVNPDLSLTVLMVVICLWLFAVGAAVLFASIKLRAISKDTERLSGSAQPTTPPAPAM